MISQLHYISQAPHLENIRAACDAGCSWIQLRVKDLPADKIIELAAQAKELCDQYNATLIINDYPQVTAKIKASGVHVGQEDMNVAAAREIAGHDAIVGGTANTLQQVIRHISNKADYVGVGPFSFTTTKKKLSPILGLAGYKQLISELKENNLNIPVIAIGGITLTDIPSIMMTGVRGIAVGGLITTSSNKTKTIKDILQLINHHK